jgi:hypothetical protein
VRANPSMPGSCTLMFMWGADSDQRIVSLWMVNWSQTQSASESECLARLNEAFAATLAPLTMVSRFAPPSS